MCSPTRFLHGLAIGFVLSTCFSLAAAEADKALEESIRQLRMGTLVIEAAPGAEVRSSSCGTSSGSGRRWPARSSAGSLTPKMRPDQKVFLDQLQRGGHRERAQMACHGARSRARLTTPSWTPCSPWTKQHEIPLRGHNIFWGMPECVQHWLKQLDDDDPA